MAFRALPALLLTAAAGLHAQQAALQAHLDREAGRSLRPPAVLVIQEAPGSHALQQAFAGLLRSEACEAFSVPIRFQPLTTHGPADPLRISLPAAGGWALVGPQGVLLAQGGTAPKAEDLSQALLRAGFRDRGQELRAYLKVYPDAVDAREEALVLLRQRAERTAQRLMGLDLPSRRERLQSEGPVALRPGAAPPRPDLSQAKPLDPAADLQAWGAFAQELDTAFTSGRWRELEGRWLAEARPLDGASPTLRLLYQRWQPVVEAALRETPGSLPFWDLLLWMGAARGALRLQPLVASLEPEPLTPAGAWPPPQALRAMLESARSPEDWSTLRELYLARWEHGLSPLHDPDPASGAPRGLAHGPHRALLDADWQEVLGPLLECSLRSGDAFRAESLLVQALESSRWNELPARAAALARRCGQDSLATRWSALRPSPAVR